ncbi:MAG: FkbM family methyltransferase, partial [Chitinophagaceae bacterium]
DVRPKTIIDAGANIGLTSIYLANKFPDSLIVSLEPDEQNFKLLKDNVHAYPNVRPVLGGLWKKPAFLTIEDAKAGNNAFTVKEVEADGPEVVKAFSVDGIMEMMGWATVDLLKIDIEGSEKEVFGTGNLPWLPKVKVLIIELHDRMVPGCSRAVFKAIASVDFSMEVKGENLVFTNNALLQS